MSEPLTMDEKIKRINELYHKSQAEGLSTEEKDEQARLRKEYINSVKANLRSQLNIQNEDGSVINLGKEHAE
jgi:uncharacterized protein YnzC (UPF0291/DUF896 family)